MKKIVILLLAVCLTAMFAIPAAAEASHSATVDGYDVTITIGGSVDEEVTLQIKSADGTAPVFVDQTAAKSDGAIFQTELPVGEYTYRAYLDNADEYVEGKFVIEEPVEPPTSEPEEDPTDPTDDEVTDPTDDEVTDPTDDEVTDPTDEDPTDSTEDTTGTDATEDDEDATSEPTDEPSDPNAPETGDRGLIVPLILMLVSGALIAVLLLIKPKAGGKYARKE